MTITVTPRVLTTKAKIAVLKTSIALSLAYADFRLNPNNDTYATLRLAMISFHDENNK